MAIVLEDFLVLTVAMIRKYGVMDTMQIEGKWIQEAADVITESGGSVSIVFTGDPQAEFINITCLFSDKQREEWKRMGMTSQKVGEA